MTTKLGAVHQSRLGVCMTSSLRVLDGESAIATRGFLGMAWVYAGTSYNSNDAIRQQDEAEYRARLALIHQNSDLPIIAKAVIMTARGFNAAHVIHGDVFAAVTNMGFNRVVTLTDNIRAFSTVIATNSAPGSNQPMNVLDHIHLATMQTIIANLIMEPGYSQFLRWLENARGSTVSGNVLLAEDMLITERTHEHDRWISALLPPIP